MAPDKLKLQWLSHRLPPPLRLSQLSAAPDFPALAGKTASGTPDEVLHHRPVEFLQRTTSCSAAPSLALRGVLRAPPEARLAKLYR